MKNFYTFLIAGVMLAFSGMASADVVQVPETLVIDFGTGIGSGGTLSYDGTDVVGTNIFIGAMNVEGAVQNNGGYTSNASLTFSTVDGTFTVVGTVGGLGTPLMTSQTLLSGTFTDVSWTYDNFGYVNAFTATGTDTKSDDLLNAVGAALDTEFAFFGFALESVNGNVVSTDIVNTATGTRGLEQPPAVPVPAAAWLFGSGLLGLVGVARRKQTV